MKKLFNNPWFISALGAAGVFYLGLSLYQNSADSNAGINGTTDDIPPFTAPGMGSMQTLTRNERDRARIAAVNTKGTGNAAIDDISWLMDIERDPFAILEDELAQAAVLETKNLPKGMAKPIKSAAKTSRKRTHPSLTAVFVGNQVRAAVINKQLLHEGDSIGQYQVVAISPNEVELRSGDMRLVLEPDA